MKSKDNNNLIIGANGLVGRAIVNQIDSKIPWVGTYNKRPVRALKKLDITSEAELEKIFEEVCPDCVINCGNLAGGVDYCENNLESAKKFHLESTKKIGMLCKEIDALFVFISTDYIFDGSKCPYKEDDEPNPLNLYGKLKLEAENWIQANLNKYLIIRTTNVYGWDPETVTPNYVMGLYKALKEKRTFNTPAFLWGNPTYVDDLADAIIELIKNNVYGVFHVTGSSFINRFDWAKEACSILEIDESLINNISYPAPGIVQRPMKSYLNTEKFKKSNITILHDVIGGLKLMKEEMRLTYIDNV